MRELLEGVPGIELILDKEAQALYHINHERSGEFVVIADEKSWFTYYFWLNDAKAPDNAMIVDIHKKPGYDPVEMFMTSKAHAGYKLLKKSRFSLCYGCYSFRRQSDKSFSWKYTHTFAVSSHINH